MSIVCLHGWGFSGSVWMLNPVFQSAICPTWSMADWDNPSQFKKKLPPQAHYWAWSFGGKMAIALAQLDPSSVLSIQFLAYNPCFIEQKQWPGCSLRALQTFHQALSDQPEHALRLFAQWQTAHLKYQNSLFKELNQTLWVDRLMAFAEHDDRSALETLSCPYRFFLGQSDPLIPAKALHQALDQVFHQKQVTVHVIRGARHACWL